MPKTAIGKQVVTAAEALIPSFAERAGAADAANSLCLPNYEDLAASGVSAAFVPQALGGMGLESIHDWILTIVTLARGDASTAIAMNMHLGVSRGMAGAYQQAQPRNPEAAEKLAEPLKAIAAGKMWICATATEPGTDNLHPLTEAHAEADGWRIRGRKIFVTMSPMATHLGMNLRMRDSDGDHLVTTMMPMSTPGLEPQDDWDALGMRASGSQAVVFNDVLVPKSAVRKIGPWGQWSVGMLMNRALANLPLVGAFLGIAEAAHSIAINKLGSQKRLGASVISDSGVQHLVGEMEIELAKCQAILAIAAQGMDDFVAKHANSPPSMDNAHRLMKDYQAAKWVVNRGAIDVVSKAMDLMGGSGYANSHPLSRLYRDVRAGPFMQPFAPTQARQYVGQVALEQWPEG